MAAPTNTSALTAIDLGTLPASVVQDVHDAGTTYTVWYSYTAQPGDYVIGVWGFGDLVGYFPRFQVYIGPAAAPVFFGLFIDATNVPTQFPVVPGTTYYFRFITNSASVNPAVLQIEAENAPDLALQTGQIIIPDDTGNSPLYFATAVLNSTTGAVEKFIDVPPGEAGDTLINGDFLISDEFIDFDLKLYDNSAALLQQIPFTWQGAHPLIRTCLGANKFYVASKGQAPTPASITTVLSDGSLGPTTWTLSQAGLRAIAANNDETILYHYGQPAGGADVQRWDIVNDLPLSNFVSITVGYLVFDILILSDDSIIVGAFKSSAPPAIEITQYDPAGTLLNTYTYSINVGSTSPHLAYAIDEPNSFWLWWHEIVVTRQVTRIYNIKISDSSLLADLTGPEYEGGIYQSLASATPTARFGNSFSCPFFILRNVIVPPTRNRFSGLYSINYNVGGPTFGPFPKPPVGPPKRNDTYIDENGNPVDLAIPTPFIITGLFGED